MAAAGAGEAGAGEDAARWQHLVAGEDLDFTALVFSLRHVYD